MVCASKGAVIPVIQNSHFSSPLGWRLRARNIGLAASDLVLCIYKTVLNVTKKGCAVSPAFPPCDMPDLYAPPRSTIVFHPFYNIIIFGMGIVSAQNGITCRFSYPARYVLRCVHIKNMPRLKIIISAQQPVGPVDMYDESGHLGNLALRKAA